MACKPVPSGYNHLRPHAARGGQPPVMAYYNTIETDQRVQAVTKTSRKTVRRLLSRSFPKGRFALDIMFSRLRWFGFRLAIPVRQQNSCSVAGRVIILL